MTVKALELIIMTFGVLTMLTRTSNASSFFEERRQALCAGMGDISVHHLSTTLALLQVIHKIHDVSDRALCSSFQLSHESIRDNLDASNLASICSVRLASLQLQVPVSYLYSCLFVASIPTSRLNKRESHPAKAGSFLVSSNARGNYIDLGHGVLLSHNASL